MGIGRQMALELAKLYKHILLIIDRRDDLFENLTKQLSDLGDTPLFQHADLSDDDSVAKLIRWIKNQSQQISLLIYNAGVVIPKRSYHTSEAEHMLVMKVNYFTPVRLIR